jgi:exodeoxyribonuclease-5
MILIGDTAQLPPVGIPMSPALDVNYLKVRFEAAIHSYELEEVMRQSLESGILFNATQMREQINEDKLHLPLFTILGFRDVEKITGSDLEEYLMDSFSGRQVEDSVVITRSNKRANLFNREIRKRILFRENDLEAGDYMMVVRNNYFWLEEDSPAGFIANGDIMEITRVGERENRFGYDFAGLTIKLLDYPELEPIDVKILLNTISSESASLSQQEMRQLFDLIMAEFNDIPQRGKRLEKVRTNPYYNALQVKFAYSLTCHKTQGGQWENVFIDQGFLKIENIDREYLRWLYTAFTRATKKVYLVGFNEKFF